MANRTESDTEQICIEDHLEINSIFKSRKFFRRQSFGTLLSCFNLEYIKILE